MNFNKSQAQSHFTSNVPPNMICRIEFEEKCVVCEHDLRNGDNIIRHPISNNAVCLRCAAEIGVTPIWK